MTTPEYEQFKILEHWKPEEINDNYALLPENSTPLLNFLYKLTKERYKHVPPRKDGKEAFVHPFNVFVNLQKSGITDEITLGTGIIHDLVEEQVDLYKEEYHLKSDAESINVLDLYELNVWEEIEKELKQFDAKQNIPLKAFEELIELVKLLTRHKRDFYYRSISAIFTCKDEILKEKAIQVKLADRMHNIQSISCFSEEDKLYQCFKNLFILNNTKKFIQEKKSKEETSEEGMTPTEKLFKKCCKSTYDSFLLVGHLSLNKKISEVVPMLQLAFHKFAWEKSGVWAVTDVSIDETHPMRLFQGIIRKYDARLHLERDKFNEMRQREIDYCRKFFSDYNFNEEQIEAIITYKDAYALREVISMLLYDPWFVINNFACSKLCSRGMVCMK